MGSLRIADTGGERLGAAIVGDNEVFGQLEPDAGGDGLHGEALLAAMEELPYITGRSREGKGTSANAVFQAPARTQLGECSWRGCHYRDPHAVHCHPAPAAAHE